MEKNQELCEILTKNESLAPIAELANIVECAEKLAEEAENIANKLSVFACKAESAIDTAPPIESWMILCDTYKNSARDFATKIKEAVDLSLINELDKEIANYTKSMAKKISSMLKNDESFRESLIRKIQENKKNGK